MAIADCRLPIPIGVPSKPRLVGQFGFAAGCAAPALPRQRSDPKLEGYALRTGSGAVATALKLKRHSGSGPEGASFDNAVEPLSLTGCRRAWDAVATLYMKGRSRTVPSGDER